MITHLHPVFFMAIDAQVCPTVLSFLAEKNPRVLLRSRKPFISDPGCDAGGFEVMDLGRVINSNLMGKVGMG